ncbi:hypothetical protein AB0J28_34765 [Streptosporangium canum]|uniref:hypothetical protein n=1 Tax=Streptosporangium canum TaxID=324952 RepID=UPI003445FECB
MQSRTYLHDLLVSTIFTEGLDAEMDLWALGFSALWIKGATLDALASAFHLDLATRAPCYLSEILDHNIDNGSDWVAEVNGWIGIVPARSDEEFLLSITEDGREALSLSMDIHGREYFKYAREANASSNQGNPDLAQSVISTNRPPSPSSRRATSPLVTPTRAEAERSALSWSEESAT